MKSIRSKVVMFAVLATLVPSIILGLVFHARNQAAIRHRAAQQLQAIAHFASRETDEWLEERAYDLRVFASSYVMRENLMRLVTQTDAAAEPASRPKPAGVPPLQNLSVYLRSVQAHCEGCRQLLILGQDGQVLVATGMPVTDLHLPSDWLEAAARRGVVAGQPYRSEAHGLAVVTLAVPMSLSGLFSGALAAEIELDALSPRLAEIANAGEDEIVLFAGAGRAVLSSRAPLPVPVATTTPWTMSPVLSRTDHGRREYTNYAGRSVLGAASRPRTLPVTVVAEKDANLLYAELRALRTLSLKLAGALLLVVGLGAYLFGRALVRPLYRLIEGAGRVAAGDLNVQLAVAADDELGRLTRIFNQMVVRLHDNREAIALANQRLAEQNRLLEQLSMTDTLTGLHNRKRLEETLAGHFERYRRNRVPFSVLMLDLDHFKHINDRYGHLAGDRVLVAVAEILAQSVRSVDHAARYGGEEFLIILFETPTCTAVTAAERVRQEVAEQRIDIGDRVVSVTVSIGIAEVATEDTDPVAVVHRADKALYQAKAQGRNRVVCA